MKHIKELILFAAAVALVWACRAAVALNWNVETTRIQPAVFEAYHGETLALEASLLKNGKPLADALQGEWKIFWQTNGMDQLWWSAPVSAPIGNKVRATFTGEMDPGANVVNGFIGCAGENYRAAFIIRFRHSPGSMPNTLTKPVPILDLANTTVINAPWPTDETIAATVRRVIEEDGITGGGTVEVDKTLTQPDMAADAKTVGDNFRGLGEDFLNVQNAAYSADQKATTAESRVEQFSIWSQGHMQEFNAVNAKANAAFSTANEAKTTAESAIGTANQASEDVSELKTWALGNDVAVKVEHATEPNATFSVLYHGETQYSSDSEAAATVARANEYTDNHLATLAGIVDEKLGEKADRAWGKYTSGGAPANGDTLIVEKKSLAITGGGNFTYIEAGTGGYYVATVSLGNTWTIESLADAQNPDNPTTLTWKDSDGNAIQTITSTSSREVYAVAGVDMMAPSCNSQGVDDVVSIPFPVVSTEPPTVLYVPDLDHYGVDDFTEANATNWPDYIKSVSWSGASGNRIAHISMKGHPGRGFFKAKFVKDGTVYTRFDKPIGFSNVVIKGIPYKVDIVTINGHKILEVIED